MDVGYARVSTDDQSLALQLDALKAAGCTRIFRDVASGAKSDRSGLDDAFSHLREGDILVVWRLDRLGRSLKQLIELMNRLQEQAVAFKSLTEHINVQGRYSFALAESIAQGQLRPLGNSTSLDEFS